MPNPVIANDSFTAGIRSEFLNTYNRGLKQIESLSRNMRMGIPGDKQTETFFYWEQVPHFKRWLKGENMPNRPFRGIQFTVSPREWAQSIDYHFADVQDDQTQSLVSTARKLGQSFAFADERIFFQIMRNATDNDLLQTIPNAPDGAALYATTAGGAARFGVTNGNLLTGTGVATAGAIRTDFFTAMSQFRRFQDGESQPLLSDPEVDDVTVYYGAANEEVFRTAFQQGTTALAASTATSNAGVSNIILDSGIKVRLIGTQRITDNDWFLFLNQTEIKPIFSVERQPVQEAIEDFQNSDVARRTGYLSIRFWMRRGFGVALPYGTIQVNN